MAAGAVITPFGKGGTRTARTDKPGVGVRAHDLLVYRVTVRGAAATFGFACKHRNILSARTLDGGQPRADYAWEYMTDDPDDVAVLLLSFVGGIRYTVNIDRISAAGALLETVRDADYESQHPDDTFPDNLAVIRI